METYTIILLILTFFINSALFIIWNNNAWQNKILKYMLLINSLIAIPPILELSTGQKMFITTYTYMIIQLIVIGLLALAWRSNNKLNSIFKIVLLSVAMFILTWVLLIN